MKRFFSRSVWARRARAALRAGVWCAALGCAGLGGLDCAGRLANTSAPHAWSALRQEILGERSAAEAEELAILDDVAEATGAHALRWVSVGVADELSYPNLAQFNPLAWRVDISRKTASLPLAKRREVLLHETGHALAFALGILSPSAVTGSPQADQIVTRSLMSIQIFHESFADAFAVAWALRENRADAQALGALAEAVAKPKSYPWASHQTSQALRALQRDLNATLATSGPALPFKLRAIASLGAAGAIAQLGAEREAACSMGARALARFALDSGYDTVRLPWEMAKTEPISPSDPMRPGLLALKALRANAPAEDPWLAALSRARPAIERAIEHARGPRDASALARQGMALAYTDALPEELDSVAGAAKLASPGRSGWRGALARGALGLADSALPSPTFGCPGPQAFAPSR